MSEPKACPCGGQVYVGELRFTGETQWCVGCLKCDRSTGKHADKKSAVFAWTEFVASPMTALTPAAEEEGELIKRLQDMRNELHVNELRNSGSADGNIYSRWGSIVSQATIALLSSPRVEETRRKALEEAAKVADEMAVNRDRVSGVAAHACRSIATRIRSLSPQGG